MPQPVQDKPTIPALSPAEAQALDQQIDSQIQGFSKQLIDGYLQLGALLKQMHDGEGHRALKFRTWRDYCNAKHDFGQTNLYLMLKIGEAGLTNVDAYPGMSSSLLIEYAKMTDFPEKLPAMLQATWDDVKTLSVREAQAHLRKYVQDNWETYKKHPKDASMHQHKDWVAQFHKQLDGLDAAGTEAYAAAMKTILAELGEH